MQKICSLKKIWRASKQWSRSRRSAREKAEAGKRVPTATAPTAAVVPGANKTDKATDGQTARPMAGKMTPIDKEICNQNNICKWHAMFGDRRFAADCRGLHLSAAERKSKGLSFSAVSSEKEDQTSNSSSGRAENGMLVDLLNECCELTGAGPVNAESTARGETFHGQFGAFGFSGTSIEDFPRLTEKQEQIVYSEHVDEMGDDNRPIVPDADNMHIALDAGDMPIALDDTTIAEEHANATLEVMERLTQSIIKSRLEMLVRKPAEMAEAEAVEAYTICLIRLQWQSIMR